MIRLCCLLMLKKQHTHHTNRKTYGSIPGVEVGTWWETRKGCSIDAIHAYVHSTNTDVIWDFTSPWVGGISGGRQGAYSVALSGGYDDDVDLGYALWVQKPVLLNASSILPQHIHRFRLVPCSFPCLASSNGWISSGGRDLKGTKTAPKNVSSPLTFGMLFSLANAASYSSPELRSNLRKYCLFFLTLFV